MCQDHSSRWSTSFVVFSSVVNVATTGFLQIFPTPKTRLVSSVAFYESLKALLRNVCIKSSSGNFSKYVIEIKWFKKGTEIMAEAYKPLTSVYWRHIVPVVITTKKLCLLRKARTATFAERISAWINDKFVQPWSRRLKTLSIIFRTGLPRKQSSAAKM